MSTAADYYELCKPRMVYANLLVAAAGFAYASKGPLDWGLLVLMLAGLGCIIAAACVFNNYHDRHIDAKMVRTQGRALVRGAVKPRAALAWGALLLAVGATLLSFTTPAALGAALAGFVIYVALYSPLKPRSAHALFVGALAGATPPVVGYAAVTNILDSTALALFIFLVLWQIPHFLAISVYRGEEYSAAGVPLFVRGPHSAKQKKIARAVFYISLAVLLAWSLALFVL